jgi:hypothetical protein
MTVNPENYSERGIGRVAASVNDICIGPVMMLTLNFQFINENRRASLP